MIGPRCAGRVVVVGMVLLLAVAACGDDTAADLKRFCEISAEIDQLGNPFELPPDEARQAAGEARILLEEGVKVAPDEIRPSAEMAADQFLTVIDLFEAADFDQTQLDLVKFEEVLSAAISDGADAAGHDLDEWVEVNCST